jgi:hypothetical protein
MNDGGKFMHKTLGTLIIIFVMLSTVIVASAHVPYIERSDYSEESPFYVWKMIEKSKAFYSWLETTGETSDDIDVFKFTVRNKPINIYVELIVPVVNTYYEDFVPWYALIGPNLPEITETLPFTVPEGYGGIIMENVEPGTERETFFEPFGGKSYYTGPILDENITEPGTYYLYCWDPYEMGGDYVLVIGKGEFFGPIDIIRGLINTIIIRRDGELHVPNR